MTTRINERINELAIQAGGVWQGGYVEQANGDSVWTEQKFVSGGDMDVEQFARLLVQECAMLVEGFEITQEVALDEYVDYEASDVINKHFGVEG